MRFPNRSNTGVDRRCLHTRLDSQGIPPVVPVRRRGWAEVDDRIISAELFPERRADSGPEVARPRPVPADSGRTRTCTQNDGLMSSSTAVLPAPGPPVRTMLRRRCGSRQSQGLMSSS
jgi:hypothetical protein